MLWGRPNVICIGAMWGPTGSDGGVVIDEAFCVNGGNGVLLKSKHLLTSSLRIGRFAGITAQEAKEVKSEFDLRQKFVPKLQGAMLVDRRQARNEVFFERGDGLFGSVHMVVVGWD